MFVYKLKFNLVLMANEERVVFNPDFEEQLSKKNIDKEVKEIKKEAQKEIRKIKKVNSSESLAQIREDRVKKEMNNCITNRYMGFYNSRLVIAKGNIGTFYSQLYKTIFGGEVLRKFKTQKEEYQNGDDEEIRNFHPDHIRYSGCKKIFSEIKTISDKSGQPFCSSNQLENYCHDLLTDAFETMFSPELEYAFFRYTRV